MLMATRWVLQAVEFWTRSGLSEVRPRQASDSSGEGDRTKGEWAWEWAACVRSGRTGVSDPCGPCGW